MLIPLEEAIQLLLKPVCIAVPTETVYGLAACYDQEEAIEQIFALKGRPRNNPLIIHISDESDLHTLITTAPPGFRQLIDKFWPGPLTCVLPVQSHVSSLVRANLPTAAFRLPSLEITRELIARTGPLVMPSANLSGKPSSTLPEHIEHDFGQNFPILEGGCCIKGVESTIVIFQEGRWVVGRQGAVSLEDLAEVLGYLPSLLQKNSQGPSLCPGLLHRHYAPKAQLFLKSDDMAKVSHILGFHGRIYPKDKIIYEMGPLDRPEEVAGNLYRLLRKLDLDGVNKAWIDMDFPVTGLWRTLRERILRASEN